ncbi:MAG: GTP-binding protein [Pseudorhodoplanes sp.]|uniref:CobW family GTP-binding protein n=1 Tax=Pseudorhodoplanes sp. TaxID=1934341 RepID=UPI003D0FFFFE
MTASDQSRRPPPPIPLTLLTGFLGAGKTTLLNRLLRDPDLRDTAVLINEFGEIALDHLLVEKIDGDMMVLSSGCLCCNLRGDLITALEKLLRNLDNGRASFARVIVETTGLADPAPLLQTLMQHPYLVMRFRLDGVVTLVDAVSGSDTLDHHPEAVKQAAVADRIVLTKADLLDSSDGTAKRDALLARLRRLNPAAPILDAAAGEATAAALTGCGLYDPARKIPDVSRWLADEAIAAAHTHDHHHHDVNRHDERVQAFTLSTERAIPAAMLDLFLELLRSQHGPNLLRMKAIVKIEETPDRPMVLHAVQHVLHPTSQLDAWPDADRRTRMVFIVRDIEPRVIRELFDAFLGYTTPDRPDATALVDNPLVPFGGLDR